MEAEEVTAPRERPRAVTLVRGIGPPALAFVVFLLAWRFVNGVLNVAPYILPPQERVLQAFVEDGPYLLEQLWHTVKMAVFGYALAIAVGVSIAVLFSQSKVLERSLYPYAIFLQTTPIIAIAPLIVIWAGIGDNSVVIIAFIIALFPIIANTTLGLTSVDNNLINLFRMNNATRWQELVWLRVPFSLPYLFTGLRISSGLSVIGAIVGEFLVGTGGVGGGMGYTLIIAAGQLKTARLFAAVFLCALLGIAFFLVVSTIGNQLLKNWHESAVRHEN
jgi:NitT/TauT family transport system permease protein